MLAKNWKAGRRARLRAVRPNITISGFKTVHLATSRIDLFYGVPNVTPYIAAVDGDWTRACLVVSKISRSKKSEALTYYDSRRPFLLPLSRRKINLLGLSVVSRRITYLSAPRPSPFSIFISL